jgi:hypothetical protein
MVPLSHDKYIELTKNKEDEEYNTAIKELLAHIVKLEMDNKKFTEKYKTICNKHKMLYSYHKNAYTQEI